MFVHIKYEKFESVLFYLLKLMLFLHKLNENKITLVFSMINTYQFIYTNLVHIKKKLF